MTRYHRSFFTGLALFAISVTSGSATTISSNPVADAFVTPGSDGSLGNNNYGAAGNLSAEASGKPQGEFQSVLRFDTAAAKSAFDAQFGVGQWSVSSVTLQLTSAPLNNVIFNTPTAGNFTISWMQNDTWVEGTGTPSVPTADGITWNTLPTFLGAGDQNIGTFAYNGATSGATTYTLTLTSGFTADLLAGNLVSFRILSADSNISYLFNSRNFNTASSRPLLSITVPEPSSCVLVLAGLPLLIQRLRRR
jgi:hypothetical protein